ncbi:MAG: hypothetical protein ABSH31_05020 [Bryobacteraceae bacterium]|jgi:hypothetical protein
MDLPELLDRLREFDLLLDTDPKFPNVTALLAGETVRGSWWAHAKAHEIHRVASELRAHPDVLAIQLVSGKITFIHRPLWMAIFAIGTAREPWQMRGLSREASALLRKSDREASVMASGDAVRELEARLLVHAVSVHTERGFHRKEVRSWRTWADSAQLGPVSLTAVEGKTQLESVLARLNKQFGARGTLPWTRTG